MTVVVGRNTEVQEILVHDDVVRRDYMRVRAVFASIVISPILRKG